MHTPTIHPSACIGQKINTSATHGLWSVKIFFFFFSIFSFQFLLPSDSPSDFSFCCFMINAAYKTCSSLFRSFYCLHLCVSARVFFFHSFFGLAFCRIKYILCNHSHNNIYEILNSLFKFHVSLSLGVWMPIACAFLSLCVRPLILKALSRKEWLKYKWRFDLIIFKIFIME